MAANAEKPHSQAGDNVSGDKIEHREITQGDKVLQDKVLGDKITQYIFHGLADAAARYKQFTELERQPYLPDRPFTPIERPLFTGRQKEIEDILRWLADQQRQTVVIYGPADVGKSSLINAGIIPGLSIVGAIPLLVQDYRSPTNTLKRDLLTQAAINNIALDDGSPAEMLGALVNRSGQGVVLILDQFERLFMPLISAGQRQELRQQLSALIDAVPPHYLHILIAIREDLGFELDPPWRDLLPGLGRSVIYLEGLDIEEARQAIELPVKLVRQDPQLYPPFYYDQQDNVISDLILPELDDLSLQEKRLILPADLQIVCYRLYEAARERDIPLIDHDLYWQVSNDKGAAYILDNHFQRLLLSLPAAYQEQARTISLAMLEDIQNFWSTAEGIAASGGEPGTVDLPLQRIREVMDEMVRAGILISHQDQGRWSYAFAGNSLANAAARAAGPQYQKKLEARKQINAVWSAWVTYDALASPGQLRLIEKYSPENDPFHLLLYLRSAVAHGMGVQPWLERLGTPAARLLLQEIEERPTAAEEEKEPRRHRAYLLLGLLDEQLPPKPAGIGHLTWTAAAHPQNELRKTALYLLFAAYEGQEDQRDALDRVEALWEADLIDRRRMAQMLGLLSNSSEEVAGKNKKRTAADRFAIWRWRFTNLYRKQERYLWTLTLGGAVGAGLGLGFLRAFLALFIPYRSGDALFFYTPNGFFLGGALTFGVLLAPLLGLQEPLLTPDRGQKRPLLLTILCGGFFLALIHLFLGIILSVGLIRAPLAHLAAILAGSALAYVIYDQPRSNWRPQIGRFLLRLALVALIMAFIQIFFILYDPLSYTLQFAWNGFFYRQQLSENLARLGLQSLLNINNWFHYFAVIDAALTGFFMAAGLLIGFLTAAKGFAAWLSLKIRAGEN